MQNIVVNMCEKFHYDRLRNDKTLADRKSDNNKNNVRSTWNPVSGLKLAYYVQCECCIIYRNRKVFSLLLKE